MQCAWIALAIAAGLLLAMVARRVQFQNLAAERTGECFATFRASFDTDDVSDELLRAVYTAVQEWCPVAEFPVRPDDDIERVYGIAEEDFEHTVMGVLKQFGRVAPPLSEHPPVIVTVRDFVLFVTECPPI